MSEKMKTTLVIMAAGMGSRFGGIKQIEKLGPSGEIILDYSVFDAKEAGFDKVVFIIRKDIEAAFREAIGTRFEDFIEVDYVFQDMEALPAGYSVPDGRTKPWGTAQAILACKGVVNEPFAVINADDYYGKEGFVKIHEFLVNPPASNGKLQFCMAGFRVGNTLSDNGTVTRGVCSVENGKLTSIVETQDIAKGDGVAITPNGEISFDTPVSMNMWGFTPEILDELEAGFPDFLDHIEGNEMKAEYLLPTVVGEMLQAGKAEVSVLDVSDKWFGVTYKADKEIVMKSFAELVEKGVYKKKLYA
ncbi:MAG: NDP-sugar synthase [Lachnospiraceae bacterium]